ncbi:hypothetical protein M1D89_20205 [Arthrobacter sp. D3-18]
MIEIPDSFLVLMLAAVIVGGFLTFGKSRQHDARLEPVEPVDWDAIEEETQTRYEDDADSARKGER